MLFRSDPRIDELRAKINCVEDSQFTHDYHDPEKRSIANALTIEFTDGSKSPEIVVEYPVGHRRRRDEGLPLLISKYQRNLSRIFDKERCQQIEKVSLDFDRLKDVQIDEFLTLFVKI